MSLVETHELSIYYERSAKQNNGPLLYIGGTGGDLRNKPNQLDSPLKDSFEIISYDQRGLGQTSKPKNKYTMKQYANDAADLIDKLANLSARRVAWLESSRVLWMMLLMAQV